METRKLLTLLSIILLTKKINCKSTHFKNDWGKDAKLIDQFIKSFEFAGESSHINLSSGNFIEKKKTAP